MKRSPTQRALADCRKLGGMAQVVERWNAFARIRVDLFTVIDILWIEPGGDLIGIQVTSDAHHAERRDKILAADVFPLWLACQRRHLEVWSYGKKGARGKRKAWTLRRERLMPNAIPASGSPRRPAGSPS